jgi:hypothetical protein
VGSTVSESVTLWDLALGVKYPQATTDVQSSTNLLVANEAWP